MFPTVKPVIFPSLQFQTAIHIVLFLERWQFLYYIGCIILSVAEFYQQIHVIKYLTKQDAYCYISIIIFLYFSQNYYRLADFSQCEIVLLLVLVSKQLIFDPMFYGNFKSSLYLLSQPRIYRSNSDNTLQNFNNILASKINFVIKIPLSAFSGIFFLFKCKEILWTLWIDCID